MSDPDEPLAENIEVPVLPEPDEPAVGVLDPDDTYFEGVVV